MDVADTVSAHDKRLAYSGARTSENMHAETFRHTHTCFEVCIFPGWSIFDTGRIGNLCDLAETGHELYIHGTSQTAPLYATLAVRALIGASQGKNIYCMPLTCGIFFSYLFAAGWAFNRVSHEGASCRVSNRMWRCSVVRVPGVQPARLRHAQPKFPCCRRLACEIDRNSQWAHVEVIELTICSVLLSS